MTRRIQRLNQLLKRELGQLLLKEFDFSKDVLITITRVETSVDLSQARVYVSTVPDFPKIIEILDNKIYFLQHQLNKRLKIRIVPKIKFIEEKETAGAARIEELLEKLKTKDQRPKT